MKQVVFFLLLTSQVAFAQNGVAFLGNIAGANWSTVDDKELGVIDEEPTISYTTFDLVGGMILVDAILDGKRGHYVLDTGAPGLVINSNELEGSSVNTATGINGEASIADVKVKDFTWAGVDYQQLDAQLMDMSCFEKITGKTIQGLIGYQFLKGKELQINYEEKVIRLVKTAKLPKDFYKTSENVNLRFLDHLPIVKMKINGKVGYFGLDTGSEVNILHTRWQKKIKSKRAGVDGQLVGVAGETQSTKRVQVDSITIGKIPLEEMAFFMLDLSTIEKDYGVQLDGILGFPFFSQHEVAVNFEDQELSFK